MCCANIIPTYTYQYLSNFEFPNISWFTMFSEFVLSFSIIIVIYLFHLQRKPKGFPPGPTSWPIVGNIFQIGLKPYEAIFAMRHKYGGILTIDLGLKRVIFLNNYKVIKEAFALPQFSGRQHIDHFADLETGENKGIVFTSGQTWTEQRKFAFSYIQSEFRSGVSAESLILNEASNLIETFKKTNGQPIAPQKVLHIATINAIWVLVTGKRYSLSDEAFGKITKHVEFYTSSFTTTAHSLMPILKHIPWTGYQKLINNLVPVYKFIQDIIDEHKEAYQEGNPRDFVDCYLDKIRSTTDPNSSFFGNNGERNMVHSLHDIFMAGTETVASTMTWIFFLMSHYHEIQEKMYSLIARQVKQERMPTLKDRVMVPFIEAVIMEVMRFSSLSPIGVLHTLTEDFEFHGYSLPKGTVVLGNLYAALHDPEVWGDPENFRPSRFLNHDETEVIRHPALIPFSTGRRVCPGELFAKDELFLFTTSVLQKFRIEFDPFRPIPPIKHIQGFLLLPPPFKIVFHSRSN